MVQTEAIVSHGKRYRAWKCERCGGRCTSKRVMVKHEAVCMMESDGPLALRVTAQPTLGPFQDRRKLATWGL